MGIIHFLKKIKKIMKFVASAILALSATVSAWSGPAHLMTARVA